MGKINILDSGVYNQISAGEVVENPASVVKELVENSIDSGADTITVMIEDGGIKSISVIDNGCGIEKDDLPKTVLPHATSKIATAKDLLTIGTLGFRGEALASIAAISEVVIKSKYAEADNAYEMIVKGGEVINTGLTNLTIGTSVTVNNVFYNTPARFSFLRPRKSEEGLITKLMQDFIFANPEISFRYFADGNLIYRTDGSGIENAIFSVFPHNVAENLISFSRSEKSHTIKGYTARPATEAIYSNRSRQYIIVNGRVVEDNTISMVIQNAYGESLMKRTFPTVILDIVMPFELVDVNVHPNKKQVRFANSRLINGIIYNAIKEALENDDKERTEQLFVSGSVIANKQPEIVQEAIPSEEQPLSTETEIKFDIPTLKVKPNIKINREENNNVAGIREYSGLVTEKINFGENFDPVKEYFKSEEAKSIPKYNILGQLFETYILIECGDLFLIIDQHAAHERILYDKLLSEDKNNLVAQQLLFPYLARIDEEKEVLLKENIDVLSSLGFEISAENGKIRLTAIPFILSNMDIDGFLSEIAENADLFTKHTEIDSIKDKIAKTACKKAIKSGDRLNDSQLDYIVNYFIEKGMPLQCPHGRPTTIKLTKTEIEKLFRRIV
ncbi:MAG TPA: DNA mismatch repair endonuclease MutL [Clostridia bacterium]|nr:DNA mismatch repair endonuclease MutL [Clostridia bacterium]